MASVKWIFFFFLVLTGLCMAQTSGWVKQESGTDTQLNKIFFVDTETGWAVGDKVILGTSNGGDSWTVQDTSDVFFRSVFFTDVNHGWAIGFPSDLAESVIYQTTNGGLHWQVQDSTEGDLYDIYFADADTGFICGGGVTKSLILKTTDGGATWEINMDYSYGPLCDIHFSDLLHGWAVGQNGLVMITENSGKLWNRHLPNLDVGYSYIYDVQFVNQDTGWCLGGEYLFKSTNGGENWELKSDPNILLYTALHFYNAETGWLLGGKSYFSTDKILYTSDGGASWQTQDSVQTDNMTSIFFIDDKSGWVAGFNGLILKTTNGGISSISVSNNPVRKFELKQNYPNPFNPKTIINYELEIMNDVELSIYNILGQKVETLVNEEQKAGIYHVEWDGSSLASGVYYYRLEAGEFRSVKKMILIK
jgi:photosystem II stability/assembly factor-like uncharacterized protein